MLAASVSPTSPAVGILLLVALVVAVLAWKKFTSTASSVATRAIFRGSHREGQALVQGRMEFSAPVGAPALAAGIVTAVNAHPTAPAVVPGLYLSARSDAQLQFTFGSKLNDVFDALVNLHPDPGGGTSGSFQLASWSETDGIVAQRREISRLRDRVGGAVATFGGTAFIAGEQSAA